MRTQAIPTLLVIAAALPCQSTNYYTSAEIEQEIDAIVTSNPAIAKKVDLTKLPGGTLTHNGNRLWALKLSDNVAVEEEEPAMVFAAQHHAREFNAPHMVVGAMRRVASAYGVDPALTAAVDNNELYFVPCANPDGVDYCWSTNNSWRKNRRNNGNGTFGVDLNRNFPFLWGRCGASTRTSSDTYRGPSAGSEPETKCMLALMRFVRPDVYIDFHSFGREVLSMGPSCLTLSSPVRNMTNFFINNLRNPMNYATRTMSASGEAPTNHWGQGGAMGLLVEVGGSFQPTWNSTVNEEARVWPGLRRVLTTWAPSIRGKVQSITGQPLEARITVTQSIFNHGEYAESRPRDGRYVTFLPQNQNYTLQCSAPGYQTATRTVSTPSYNSTIVVDFELTPIGVQPSSLTLQGTGQIGTTTTLSYNSPGDAGDGYWIAVSGGVSPPIVIGARQIALRNDNILATSAIPGVIPGNIGTLPANETGVASLFIPNVPALVGINLATAGITLNPSYNFQVKKFSPSVQFTIQ